ncbi:MAG: hypothetical protein AABX99_00830 [Nanoarchaeota archaeon]
MAKNIDVKIEIDEMPRFNLSLTGKIEGEKIEWEAISEENKGMMLVLGMDNFQNLYFNLEKYTDKFHNKSRIKIEIYDS